MVPVESECAVKYEELKNLARGNVNNFKIISFIFNNILDIIIIIFVAAEEFEFKKSYAQSIKDLHERFDSKAVALYWPEETRAKSCIKAIRDKILKSTSGQKKNMLSCTTAN
jgi:hypothetical protein